jgi:beta-galactosidase
MFIKTEKTPGVLCRGQIIFKQLPDFYASQRSTFDPISGTKDWKLFQSFRYGIDKLRYEFPAPDGEYLVELYFTEPWYGTGGGLDCKGWRLFDVAINDNVVLKDLDIWSEVGHDSALKKTFVVKSKNGKIVISFPNVKASQAIISAIAIATKDKMVKGASASPRNIDNVTSNSKTKIGSWQDINSKQYSDSEVVFTQLPAEVFGADYLQIASNSKSSGSFITKEDSEIYLFSTSKDSISGYKRMTETAKNSDKVEFSVFHKKVKKGEKVSFENSTIAVVPTYNMGEKDDSRPVVLLEGRNSQNHWNRNRKRKLQKSGLY